MKINWHPLSSFQFCGFNSVRRKRQVEQAEYDRITIAIKIDEALPDDDILDTEGEKNLYFLKLFQDKPELCQ